MSTYLLTGSSGKTSGRLARLLHAQNKDFVVASRKGTAPAPFKAVTFDFTDEATWGNAFAAGPIAGVYLVFPAAADPEMHVKKFIDFAVAKGVPRFVLLSSTVTPAGGPYTGQIHSYLMELQRSKNIEWAAVRPTWFMENFSEAVQLATIRDDSRIQSAADNGVISFISSDDIAAVACCALVDAKPHNTDYILVGPDRLTYEDVATRLSKLLGRTIAFKRNNVEEQTAFLESCGVPPGFAGMLAGMDLHIAGGGEDITNDVVEKVTGRPAKSFDTFAKENKDVWMTK